MDAEQLMNLAQVLVLRADTTDIMDIAGVSLLEAEHIKLDLIHYLQNAEDSDHFMKENADAITG